VLALSLASGYVWKALTRRSHTCIASRVSAFGKIGVKGLRLTNSQVVKITFSKARLWSHGDVRLTPGVKLHRVGFHKGPMDSLKVPTGNQRSRFSSRRI
jgi:hypothetical protein